MSQCVDFTYLVRKKYDYLSATEAEWLVNKAKSICVEQLYPADLTINYRNFDWSNPRFEMWVLDCVDEIIEKNGISSVVAYKENGMSWTFDKAGISQSLLDRLPRMAHTIRSEE